MSLVPNETWLVQDSTKIQSYMACPRAYFYEYVLGWRREEPNLHLVFGQAWHHAMEQLLLLGYNEKGLTAAMELLTSTYREQFSPAMDDNNYPKTPGFALEMLVNYMKRYRDDHSHYDVLYTEISGTVSVDDRRVIYFKTDSILRDRSTKKHLSLEHKTTKSASRQWSQDWLLKLQIGTYTHVLRCLYGDATYGVVVNGAIFQKTRPDFLRVHVPKTNDQMAVWHAMLLHYLDDIEWNFERLLETGENEHVLTAFPMNVENCTKYYGCSYHDFCVSWTNPLHHCENVPFGFKREYWDPRKEETTHKMEIATTPKIVAQTPKRLEASAIISDWHRVPHYNYTTKSWN